MVSPQRYGEISLTGSHPRTMSGGVRKGARSASRSDLPLRAEGPDVVSSTSWCGGGGSKRLRKYQPEFTSTFANIAETRSFCRTFMDWYNNEHRHSGIALLTPADVHYGRV